MYWEVKQKALLNEKCREARKIVKGREVKWNIYNKDKRGLN